MARGRTLPSLHVGVSSLWFPTKRIGSLRKFSLWGTHDELHTIAIFRSSSTYRLCDEAADQRHAKCHRPGAGGMHQRGCGNPGRMCLSVGSGAEPTESSAAARTH